MILLDFIPANSVPAAAVRQMGVVVVLFGMAFFILNGQKAWSDKIIELVQNLEFFVRGY